MAIKHFWTLIILFYIITVYVCNVFLMLIFLLLSIMYLLKLISYRSHTRSATTTAIGCCWIRIRWNGTATRERRTLKRGQWGPTGIWTTRSSWRPSTVASPRRTRPGPATKSSSAHLRRRSSRPRRNPTEKCTYIHHCYRLRAPIVKRSTHTDWVSNLNSQPVGDSLIRLHRTADCGLS